MGQELTIKLSKEEVINIIKKNLVQVKDSLTPAEYVIKFEVDEECFDQGDNQVTITIVKEISIGGFRGVIKEELDYDIIVSLLIRIFEQYEYSLDDWDFIISSEDKSFGGIEVLLVPLNTERSFIRNLSKQLKEEK